MKKYRTPYNHFFQVLFVAFFCRHVAFLIRNIKNQTFSKPLTMFFGGFFPFDVQFNLLHVLYGTFCSESSILEQIVLK